MTDRAEVLAKRGTPADKRQSAAMATQVLLKLSPTFEPGAPAIARLKRLQQQ